MKVHELKAPAKRNRRRSGRGISAGRGKTAGRGTKGQNSRSGGRRRPGFEGGQNPLMQRIPKQRGHHAIRNNFQAVFTGQLNRSSTTSVTAESLKADGIIRENRTAVKLVLKGEITKKLSVSLALATKGAEAAIAEAGGSFTASKPTNTKKDRTQ